MPHNLLYAFRNLRQNPAFTLTAILALALGMGANTAMFTVIRAVLLKPLDYPDPGRLVRISGGATIARYEETRAAAHSYTAIGAFRGGLENVTLSSASEEPEVLKQARVSANFLQILGVQPALGRTFLPGEDKPAGASVAMISSDLWQRRFAGQASAIGQVVTLGSARFTIIGVLPPAFQFPASGIDIWATQPDYGVTPLSPLLTIYGRLKPGVELDQASAELKVLNAQYNSVHPGMLDAKRSATERVEPFREFLVARVRSMLWMLFGAVGFVLLIACSNVASLLLARAASRSREFAVRAALGASRGRLISQLLAESLLLAGAAGILGLFIARVSLASVSAFNLPRATEIHLDYSVFAFTAALSILSGVLFGLVPSLGASSPNLIGVLRAAGENTAVSPGNRAWLGALVGGQVALSLVLLIGAALLIESIARLGAVNPGFNPSHLLTMQLSLSPSRYDNERKRADFYDRLLLRLQSLPGVRNASFALVLPFSDYPMTPVQLAALPPLKLNQRPLAMIQMVTPSFFRTLEIPLIRGREFNSRDTITSGRVAIVNERLARHFWPGGQDPIGQRLLVGASPLPVEIVGITADYHQGLGADPIPGVFRPSSQVPPVSAALAIRTEGDPLRQANAVRGQLLALDPDQAASNVRTMETLARLDGSERQLVMKLLTVFAAVAMVLTLVGIYGMVAYSITQRTREFGIRTALGAARRDILRLVLTHTLALTLGGIIIGIAGSFALSRVMKALLFQTSPTDPLTYAAIALAFILLALTASYLPARRAARIDPMLALRQ